MRQAAYVFIVCVIAFGGMVYVLLSGGNPESPGGEASNNAPVVWEPNRTVRDVTPNDVLQLPETGQAFLERLPAIKPTPLPSRSPKPERWVRPMVLDAGTIRSGDQVISLADILPVKLNELCKDREGETWPCGRYAKSSLARFVRSRTMDCDRREGLPGKLVTRCRIGDQDISKWLVIQGWAQPYRGTFQDEYDQAKREKRGIWRNFRP